MLAAFLLIALTGGYIFSAVFIPSRFNSAREDGHRLYFRAVFYAVFLVAVSALTCLGIIACGWVEDLVIAGKVPEPNASSFLFNIGMTLQSGYVRGVIFSAPVLIGPLLAHALNLVASCSASVKQYLFERAIKNHDFERMVYRSLTTQIPLLITLRSRKIYVGWPVGTPDPTAERRTIRILPMLSGYRQESSLTVEFTTNYYEILNAVAEGRSDMLNHLEIEDLEVVLPTDQIDCAHAFDVVAYEEHFSGKVDAEAVHTESKEEAANSVGETVSSRAAP